MFFLIHFLLCSSFCLEFLKNKRFSKIISPFFKQILFFLLSFYFLCCFFFATKIFFFFFPIVFLLSFLWFLQNHNHKSLLSHLHNLLFRLSSQMKLGLSFMNAWQKSIKEIEQNVVYKQLVDISEVLQFERHFQHSNPYITNLVQDLIEVKKSPQPLRRLNLLVQKIKIEQSFYRKASQVLLQLRIQSIVIAFLYISLFIWSFMFYGTKYPYLMLLSFICFVFGLVWIFKAGRKMKWSL